MLNTHDCRHDSRYYGGIRFPIEQKEAMIRSEILNLALGLIAAYR